VQAVLAAGITVTFIDEGATDPYDVPDAYAAGVARATASEARLAGYYPDVCSIVYVLSDQDVSTPGPDNANLKAHAQGIDVATTRPGWIGYSNRYGIDAARQVATKLRASWVPVTWGADGSDALVQQIGSPVDGLDVDTIQNPEWGQWRSVMPPPPTPPSPEGTRMEIIVGPVYPKGHLAILVDPSGRECERWLGDGTDGTEVNGIPKDAFAWQQAGGRGAVSIVGLDAAPFVQFLANLAATKAPLDVAAAAKAIAAALPAQVGLTDAQIEADVHAALIGVLHGTT
jgi:hypothetical protein